jgi:hypothetical protein
MTEPAPLPHSRAFELLPWLLNGTLEGAEREAVEAHARDCIACRRELKEQQRLRAAMRSRAATDISAEAGFDRLDQDLDASTTARRRYTTIARFAVSAAAGIGVLAILLWFTPLPQLDDANYSTLATAPAAATTLLDVVFAEDTTAAEMQALLDDIGGEIVAGPSELGRYSVRLGGERIDDARVAQALGVLEANSRVRFAGRSLIEPAP